MTNAHALRPRRRPAAPSFDTLEDRALLSNVTVGDIETGLNQLGAIVNQTVSGAQLLGKVPFLQGMSAAVTQGGQNIQSKINALTTALDQTAQPSDTVQTFLARNASFSTPLGTVQISNVTPNGNDAYQFTLVVTPVAQKLTLNATGGQSFGKFAQLNLGQFAFSVSNQVQLHAIVQVDSSGNLTVQRSSGTTITDTPTVTLAQRVTVTGGIPAPGRGSIPITAYVGDANGLSISPQVTIGFGTSGDFVGLSQLLASAKPTVSQGATINIPFGVGIAMNSGDQSGDQLPAVVFQDTYKFSPIDGTLTPTVAHILVNGTVVGTYDPSNPNATQPIDTAPIAAAVLHDIAGPMFDKYESYIPQDVRDFLLGDTMIGGQPLKTYLFGETPLDIAALALKVEAPPASIGILALKNMLEVGQYGTMLDNLDPSNPLDSALAQADAEQTESATDIRYNILDDPVGTILTILSGQAAPLVTWKIDAVDLMVTAADEYLTGSDDPAQHALELQALEAVGIIQKINPADPNSQLEITIGNPVQLAQNFIDALKPAADSVGLGSVLSNLDNVIGQIGNLGLNFSFTFYGGATFGVNSSFLADPTAHGILDSLYISAPGMNGPGTFGNLLHMQAHADIDINLPQDLTGSAHVMGPSAVAVPAAAIPHGGLGGGFINVSAGNGSLDVSVGGQDVSIGGPVGQAASAVAGAFPGGAQAAADALYNAVTDPAGTFNALINKLGSLSLSVHFDVNDLDVSIPAGSDATTPTELTVAELVNTPAECTLTFKADATLDLEGSLSAIGHDVLSGGTGVVPLLEVNTQCDDNPFVAQEGGLIDVAGTMLPFASTDYSNPSHVYVSGTIGDDVIALSGLAGGGVQVRENGQFLDFPAGITAIEVDLNVSSDDGNDSVTIESDLPSSISVTVNAGGGDDIVSARDSSGREFGGPVQFNGGGGNDTVIGGAGTSNVTLDGNRGTHGLVEGGSGNLVAYDFGEGDDTLAGGAGKTQIYDYGTGNDTLIAGDGYSDLEGGPGNDVLKGPSDPARVNSSGIMVGGGGDNVLDVGTVSQGNWVLIGGRVSPSGQPLNPPDTGSQIIVGGQGNDTVVAGDASVSGSQYRPIGGSGGTSAIFGGPGNDAIYGGTGGDFISGGWLGSDSPAGTDSIVSDTSAHPWVPIASAPGARVDPAGATGSDGRIYVIGGYGPSGFSSEVDAYNPATQSWSQVASLPVPRDSPAAAAGPNGKIYVMGGYSPTGPTSEVDVYDPATGAWSQVASLPHARYRLAAAAGADGKIYAIGGDLAGSTTTGEVDVYNPTTNTWTQLPSLITPRDNLAAATGADGKIYAISGFATSLFSGEVDAFDPVAGYWIIEASLPHARDLLAAAPGADGRIYAIGGYGPGGLTSEVDAYDPAHNTWSTAGSLPSPRAKLAAAVGKDGTIYAADGSDANGYSSAAATYATAADTVVRGDVSQGTSGGSLVAIESLPPPPPIAPTLSLGTDTGVSHSDGVTRMNGSAGAPLVFQITGVFPNNGFVRLYDVTNPAQPIPLGGPVQATNHAAAITLAGTPLADGTYEIEAEVAATVGAAPGALSTPETLTVQTSLRVTAITPSASLVPSLPNNQIVVTFNHPLAGLAADDPTGHGITNAPFGVMLIPSGPDGLATQQRTGVYWSAPSGVDSGDLPLPAIAVYHVNADGTSTITLMPQEPLATDVYLISIGGLTDLAGNPTASAAGNVGTVYAAFDDRPATGGAGPRVTSVSAYNGSVPINNNRIPQPDTIGVQFSTRMDPYTVNTGTVQLFAAGGTAPLAAGVAYSPTTQTAYLTPEAPLVPGTVYYVSVSGSVTDAQGFPNAGYPLDAPYTTSFTVGAAGVGPGASPLKVLRTNPLDGTAWSAPLGYGAVTFSEPIALASLSRFSAMLISQTGGVTTGGSGYADVPLDAKLAFNPNTNQLIVVPTGLLRNNIVYLFSLNGITAKNGDSLAGAVYSTFLLNAPAQPFAAARASVRNPGVETPVLGVSTLGAIVPGAAVPATSSTGPSGPRLHGGRIRPTQAAATSAEPTRRVGRRWSARGTALPPTAMPRHP